MIPETEKVWEHIIIADGSEYYITAKRNDRSMYFLYDAKGKKIGKNGSPSKLKEKIQQSC